jgi:hypothetical protein
MCQWTEEEKYQKALRDRNFDKTDLLNIGHNRDMQRPYRKYLTTPLLFCEIVRLSFAFDA